MAKNTGRGSRAGTVADRAQPPAPDDGGGMWVRRESSAGRFLQAKTSGGSFKGPPQK